MKSLLPTRIGSVPHSETLTPFSHKQRMSRFSKENVDPNTVPLESDQFPSPPTSGKSPAVRSRSPFPPRPSPSSNRLKRKLSLETLSEKNGCTTFPPIDCGVQVMVRVRPLGSEEEGDEIARKISPNSISILEHSFTFDSVVDSRSTQHDIFQLVGLPFVENCLAGFNSSIFAYGQTGSGKTYTMWGASNSLSADCLLSPERGLTPRVFEQLFFRINEEQAKNSDKQLHFQCRCSFLEIYNEQITDLLDPTQRNLQIREDAKKGIFVDCLTEEYVSATSDVIQLLIKGLANRRIGATSINAESSRSHCVFTCIVERRFKSMADGFISLRTSKINLVDLAGSEKQKATGAVGERLKEAGSINRSLSQLGNLINILAEVSQSGKHRHIPYRDSRLTFLLQDSLGGNSKLAMICTVSPSKSCKSETFSTLRFAQRAKAIKNKAIVNETTEDDADVLREQIRQLKDELLRMKSNGKLEESNGSCSIGWNVRRSLSLLRFNLCRPRTMPVEDDSDEEMEIVQEGVESFGAEACFSSMDDDKSKVNEEQTKFESFSEQKPDKETLCTFDEDRSNSNEEQTKLESSKEQKIDEKTLLCNIHFAEMPGFASECLEDIDRSQKQETEELAMSCKVHSPCKETLETTTEQASPSLGMNEHDSNDERKMIPAKRKSLAGDFAQITEGISSIGQLLPSNEILPGQFRNSPISPSHSSTFHLNIVADDKFPVQSPADNYSRKSPRTSSSTSASQKRIMEDVDRDSSIVNASFSGLLSKSTSDIPSIRSNKTAVATTENLAASLSQGLEVINGRQHRSSLGNSSFSFSLNPVDSKSLIILENADIGAQSSSREPNQIEGASAFLCSFCKKNSMPLEKNDVIEKSELQIVPVDDGLQSYKMPQSAERFKKQVPKEMEKVLAGAIRRELALEDRCSKQTAEIMHLNRLVQQYKHERECMEIMECAYEDKISRLECLMGGIMPAEEFMEKEFLSLKKEYMILKEKYENHPEVLKMNIELNRVQNELDEHRNFFDMGERDVLVEEIQDMRSYLLCYIDSSSSSNQNPLLQLTPSMEPCFAPLTKVSDTKDGSFDENFELKGISLYKDLKSELEACRSLAEKTRIDLESEKKCSQELKEALHTALQVHTRTLEHYADLEEKHMALLQRHRKLREGIFDVKKLRGVKCESKFIESLSAQIETLSEEREKERLYWRDENKGLQTQLRDTAEAVLAAGELLTRLKAAEEAAANAKKQALIAERKTEKAYQEIDDLKKKYEAQITALNQSLADSHSTKEKIDELSAENERNCWFYGYDRCNI